MIQNQEYKKKLIARGITLGRKTILLIDRFPNKKSAWVIADQLLRASTSVGANISEAQAAASKKDFINFLNYSLKSANETKFWLILSKDLSNILVNDINILLSETIELSNILGSSIKKLKNIE
ncbi:four helix bundle protein [Candidatus Roizmanbacteria bacterium CG09_land_8_20_14_0_10_41_9]|uniref:Four helix bundle protein n=2 Tax=Bacteria candidate phyla TaxID=1783234 RepID=A0A2H0WT36_9BACT|nr:MAG: four helix bundle protein [Candidatus Roizmanbacteria bacterium CG09_land_8_20_14_0_10_41_9]PIU24491.1 MAG: four helix bundle protein [Candidatus Berkelbacteria bacterium CG08_land_8_20_14_0_20_39_8]